MMVMMNHSRRPRRGWCSGGGSGTEGRGGYLSLRRCGSLRSNRRRHCFVPNVVSCVSTTARSPRAAIGCSSIPWRSVATAFARRRSDRTGGRSTLRRLAATAPTGRRSVSTLRRRIHMNRQNNCKRLLRRNCLQNRQSYYNDKRSVLRSPRRRRVLIQRTPVIAKQGEKQSSFPQAADGRSRPIRPQPIVTGYPESRNCENPNVKERKICQLGFKRSGRMGRGRTYPRICRTSPQGWPFGSTGPTDVLRE